MFARTAVAALATLLIAGSGVTGNFRHDPATRRRASPGPSRRTRVGLWLGPLPLAFARLVVDDDPEIGLP